MSLDGLNCPEMDGVIMLNSHRDLVRSNNSCVHSRTLCSAMDINRVRCDVPTAAMQRDRKSLCEVEQWLRNCKRYHAAITSEDSHHVHRHSRVRFGISSTSEETWIRASDHPYARLGDRSNDRDLQPGEHRRSATSALPKSR